MTETIAPPKQEVRTVSFEEALCAVWNSVEELLEEMPDSSLEARRLITRELRFEPRPEELQAIVRMAGDSAHKGLRRELPRSMLSLRVLAERELSVLLGEHRLEADGIEVSAALLPRIEQEAARLGDRLQSSTDAMAGLTVEDRDYLLQIGEALRCPDDAIQVAMLLAPRLALFVEKAVADELHQQDCALSPRELEMVRSTVRGSDQCGSQPSRICINALAVRSIMEDDLRAWEETFSNETPDDDGMPAREAAQERLRADKIAYQFVSERLQKQQDMALVAGLTGFASEIREIARSLFSVNLELVHALRDGATPLGDGGLESGVEQAALLEKYRAAEEEADDIASKRVSKEEIILKALHRIRNKSDRAPSLPRFDDLRRERRRFWLMSAVALFLLALSVFVHLVLLRGPEGYIEVSTNDFKTSLQLAQIDSVGGMMHTKVIGWAELSEMERIGMVEQLGRQAAAKGFVVVYVVDDNGEPAAIWSEESGVELE